MFIPTKLLITNWLHSLASCLVRHYQQDIGENGEHFSTNKYRHSVHRRVLIGYVFVFYYINGLQNVTFK